MPSTRYACSDDPANAPQRNLSSVRNRTINVSLALASRAASRYREREHREACLWLANLAANSQRIQLCWQRRGLRDPLGTLGRIAEADLCDKLGLTPLEVYRALTGHDEADLPGFTSAVANLRGEFEASLPRLVKTHDSATITQAFSSAADEHNIVTVEGKWRHGKTEEAERIWLQNLHRCVWLHCPSDNTENSFINAFARVLGISVSGGKKTSRIRDEVKEAFGIGLIDTVIIDEAHGLFPSDLVSAKPVRLEYVRELRDTKGVGSILIITDQFALALELAKQNNHRYAPGQVAGRRDQYRLRDAHTEGEIRAIAKLHAGAIEEEAVDALRQFAQREEGYLGVMVLAAKRARRTANARGLDSIITASEVADAIQQEQTDERVVEIAKAAKHQRRGRFRVIHNGGKPSLNSALPAPSQFLLDSQI